MLGVVYVLEAVKNGVAPVRLEYQSISVPEAEVALKVTAPWAHQAPLVTTGAKGNGFTVVVMLLDVAGLPVGQT